MTATFPIGATWPPSGGASGSPFDSMEIVDGGMYVPRRSLDRWNVPLSGLINVAIVGDSVPQGTALDFTSYQNGYLDGLCARIARAIGNQFGGLRGSGFYGLWRSGGALGYINTASEWTVAGTFTQVASNGINARVPYQGCFTMTGGAGTIATFTPPPAVAARYATDLVTRLDATTVAAGSNGVNTNTFVGAQTLNVADASAFPAAGTVAITRAGLFVVAVVTYTGKGATTLTGCTLRDGSDAFAMATGDRVANDLVIESATAAFSAATDHAMGVYGNNLPRSTCVRWVADATHAVVSAAATAAATGGVLGMVGRQIAGAVAQVEVYTADLGGALAWSWSDDNGGSWNNVVPAGVLKLARNLITTALPSGNFKIRAADAAGVAHTLVLAGIRLRNAVNPTTGAIVDNLCRDGGTYNPVGNGGNTTGLLPSAAPADYLNLLDNDGSGINQSLQPSLVIAMFSNDAGLVGAGTITLTQFKANVQTFIDRLFGYSDIILVNPMEQLRADATSEVQAACRQALKEVAALNGVAVLDVFDAWAAQGESGFAAANAAGLMINSVHPSLEGHADIAGHVLRMLAITGV